MFFGNQEKILSTLLSKDEFDYFRSSICSITFGLISPDSARQLLINRIGIDRYKFLQTSMQEEFDRWYEERGVSSGNES